VIGCRVSVFTWIGLCWDLQFHVRAAPALLLSRKRTRGCENATSQRMDSADLLKPCLQASQQKNFAHDCCSWVHCKGYIFHIGIGELFTTFTEFAKLPRLCDVGCRSDTFYALSISYRCVSGARRGGGI
jgi:hypothetical protein